MRPPGCPNMDFDDGDYEQDGNADPKPPTRCKKVSRLTNLFIDAKAGVDGDASVKEITDKTILIMSCS